MGEITRIEGGGTPASEDFECWHGDVPWVTPADLSGHCCKEISRGGRSISEKGLSQSAARILPKGTVLFSSRAPIGYVAIAANPLATNQGFKSFVPPPEICSSYLFYYLQLAKPLAIELASGTTFKELSKRRAGLLPFPLAPLPEQHRIVAKIELLLASLVDGFAALEGAETSLERYRASVLKAAVEGRLTERWREENPSEETGEDLLQCSLSERQRRWEEEQLAKLEAKGKLPRNWQAKYKEPVKPDTSDLPDLPEGWCWATVEQLDVALMNGYGRRSDTPGGEPRMVLRLADISHDQISYQNPRYLDCTTQQVTKYGLDDHDVLIVRVNGSADLVGRMVDCRDRPGEVLFCDHFIRARCTTVDTAAWLRLCSNSERFRSHVERSKVSTAGQHTVSQGVILPFALPLPPKNELQAVLKLVDQRTAQIETLASTLANGRVSASYLRQSILRRAFQGRLVPQDPSDEPASTVVGRIRIERQAATRRRKRRSVKTSRQLNSRDF